MKHNNLLKRINECASSGSTSAASIATVTKGNGSVIRRSPEGAIGVGFDPEKDWGIYEKPKKRSKKEK